MKKIDLDRPAEELAVDLVYLRTVHDLEGVSDKNYDKSRLELLKSMLQKIANESSSDEMRRTGRTYELKKYGVKNVYDEEERVSRRLSTPDRMLYASSRAGHIDNDKFRFLVRLYLDNIPKED